MLYLKFDSFPFSFHIWHLHRWAERDGSQRRVPPRAATAHRAAAIQKRALVNNKHIPFYSFYFIWKKKKLFNYLHNLQWRNFFVFSLRDATIEIKIKIRCQTNWIQRKKANLNRVLLYVVIFSVFSLLYTSKIKSNLTAPDQILFVFCQPMSVCVV